MVQMQEKQVNDIFQLIIKSFLGEKMKEIENKVGKCNIFTYCLLNSLFFIFYNVYTEKPQ